MERHTWRRATALRHSPVHATAGIPVCEFCDSDGHYSSSLIDADEIVREIHWHCRPHRAAAVELLEEVKFEGLTRVVRERHWMHIWKVGRVPCRSCPDDSRVVVSYADSKGDIVEQVMLCERHAPEMDDTPNNDQFPGTIVDDVVLGLGTSFTVDTD